MKKALIGIIVCMLLVGAVLPVSGYITNEVSKLNNSDDNLLSNGDFNLKVEIIPNKRILPRLYFESEYAVFNVKVFNNGPDMSDECTVTFEINKIIGKELGNIYSNEWEINQKQPNNGFGKTHFVYCSLNGFFGVYKAQATIDIVDNNPKDNSASFIYLVVAI